MADTQFLDDLDEARLRSLKPYRAVDSNRTINELFAEINHDMWIANGPDYRQVGPDKLVVEVPQRFDDLLAELRKVAGLRFMTCRDMLKAKPAANEIICNIRHDIDRDLRGALQQAVIEAKYGVSATYYVLHTSCYYGTLREGVHYRNRAAIHVYRQIQDLGHEIGFHTDPMQIYQNLGIDGAQAVVEELKWLRSHGLKITGSVAHNSAAAYGASNFGIFKGRPPRLEEEPGPRSVVHHGKWSPLQVLDERELGLEYEGDDVFWQHGTRVEYACLKKHDGWLCQSNKQGQRRSLGPRYGRLVECWRDQEGLVDHVNAMPKGCYLLLSINPEFYGLRHSPDSAPLERSRRTTQIVNPRIGWQTCEPNAIEADYADFDGRQEFQSLAVADEWGMLQRPPAPAMLAENEIRILFFGRDNLHARTVCVPAKIPARVELDFERRDQRKVRTWARAAPGMGFSRYYAWLRSIVAEISPHYVVLGIGANEPECSDPELWSRITGFDPEHPPGAYVWSAAGTIREVKADADYRQFEHVPSARQGRYSLTLADSGLRGQTEFMHLLNNLKATLDYVLGQVRESGATPILLVEECGESVGVWSPEASNSQRIQAHNIMRSYMKAWLPEADLTVVDPYERMVRADRRRPTHWQSRPEWNLRGQRIAAEMLTQAIREREAIDGNRLR